MAINLIDIVLNIGRKRGWKPLGFPVTIVTTRIFKLIRKGREIRVVIYETHILIYRYRKMHCYGESKTLRRFHLHSIDLHDPDSFKQLDKIFNR